MHASSAFAQVTSIKSHTSSEEESSDEEEDAKKVVHQFSISMTFLWK